MHVWTHNIKGTKLEDFQYSERAFLIHVCNSPCNTLPNSMDFYIWHYAIICPLQSMKSWFSVKRNQTKRCLEMCVHMRMNTNGGYSVFGPFQIHDCNNHLIPFTNFYCQLISLFSHFKSERTQSCPQIEAKDVYSCTHTHCWQNGNGDYSVFRKRPSQSCLQSPSFPWTFKSIHSLPYHHVMIITQYSM